jgi:hypothetical protein
MLAAGKPRQEPAHSPHAVTAKSTIFAAGLAPVSLLVPQSVGGYYWWSWTAKIDALPCHRRLTSDLTPVFGQGLQGGAVEQALSSSLLTGMLIC